MRSLFATGAAGTEMSSKPHKAAVLASALRHRRRSGLPSMIFPTPIDYSDLVLILTLYNLKVKSPRAEGKSADGGFWEIREAELVGVVPPSPENRFSLALSAYPSGYSQPLKACGPHMAMAAQALVPEPCAGHAFGHHPPEWPARRSCPARRRAGCRKNCRVAGRG